MAMVVRRYGKLLSSRPSPVRLRTGAPEGSNDPSANRSLLAFANAAGLVRRCEELALA